ncbi:uncharacterized protein LOC143288158 [Babylonia areolata]|uniref:uncharacterized protein LOC143288158 n=1 Tax=Babylonia areolata TaxID=304850 RepID=UPI003FD4CCF9
MSDKEREALDSAPINPAVSIDPDTQSSVMTPVSQPLGTYPLQDTRYWTVVTLPGQNAKAMESGDVCEGTMVYPPKDKSLLEAYLLGVTLGMLGAHHYYLGRPSFCVMYFLTLGLFGCGWVVDLVRMPCLVASVNKANKERYEQLQQLQHALQQQRLQRERQYGPRGAWSHSRVVFRPFHPCSLVDAYVLWFPLGLFGYHHFYLRNYSLGFLYHMTLGLLGIGWLIDLFRMPSLVQEANARSGNEAKSYSQCTAHVWALSPTGILGGHHFYLNRPLWGSLWSCTLGLLGVGWVFDWFRVTCLVKRANAVARGDRSRDHKYVDDAYILCFPLGFTGLHHFYLRRYGWGVLYLLTLGVFGIGWLIDWFRLPLLVKECNANRELSQRMISGGSGILGSMNSSEFASQSQVVASSPQGYPPATGYGYYQTNYPTAPYQAASYPGYVGPGYIAEGEAPPSYAATMENSNPSDDKQ